VTKIEYFAHYDKKKGHKNYLKDHLGSVSKLVYQQIPPVVKFDDIIDNKLIKDVSYYIGLFHDLGKYSDYWSIYFKERIVI
jgi:CRISPR-associated endonuclease/helicase Cas3